MPQPLKDTDISLIIVDIFTAAARFEERVYTLQRMLHPPRAEEQYRGVRGFRGGVSMTEDQMIQETQDSIHRMLLGTWSKLVECVEYIRSPRYKERTEECPTPEPEAIAPKVSRFRLATKGKR